MMNTITPNSDEIKIEKLAKSLWEYYYPNGGSIFQTFESLPYDDKIKLIAEAKNLSLILDGRAEVKVL